MLSFSSEFPVSTTNDSGLFLRAARDWILGSPHTSLSVDSLDGLEKPSEWSTRVGGEKVEVLRVSSGTNEAAAVRYSKNEEGLEWVTTIVFSRDSANAWVGIRLSCESNHPAVRLPPAKKPLIVRALLDQLNGADDGVLSVAQSARFLTNDNIALAAKLIDGTSGCRLPIVYVSCGFHGDHIVRPSRLAARLAGMAHVVVEPNRQFSLRLKIEVDSNNVYGGTIGVYWPDGGGRRSFFIGRQYDTDVEVEDAIFEEIRTALANRRPLVRCTWASVQEQVSRLSYDALKATGSQAVERYVEEFDKELQAKDERLADAEREIARLNVEVRKYESRTQAQHDLSLKAGQEQGYFPGEIGDIVLDALAGAIQGMSPESRRWHVLQSILDSNQPEGGAKARREELKNLLRDYRSMDAKVRKGLQDLGFSIQDEGKHYKLMYNGDGRYTFSLAKTGSDHKGGLNAVSDIAKRIF